MGVGGNFWDLLKPYGRNEGFDFLRNKRVAVDLSFWIVQHETALKNKARNPHLRITFFRTINLFSKLGAFPVFVVDGVPSPLKSRARIERFFRYSGIDLSGLPKAEDGVSVERNGAFTKCVQECVNTRVELPKAVCKMELLEILGMPVIKARCEAEALCAQLNSEGHVDACITADSDAFLYGAKCVIKFLRPNSKEPFECYHMSDIEDGLQLKRAHLVAIALLVGSDHDLCGVSGIGMETALRFVRMFPEDEILNRLHEVGNGDIPFSQIATKPIGDCNNVSSSDGNSPKIKSPHCSYCGHPGSKRAHLKFSCKYCAVSGSKNCMQKPVGFKCECSTCNMDRITKEQKKHESWQISICSKIAMEKNFPNDEIIEMYTRQNHGNFSENECPSLKWDKPKVEALIDFLGYHQQWDPSYIRQRILPMLSTNVLREMASDSTKGLLLHGEYEFHSIQRVKIRYGHPYFLVKWKKAAPAVDNTSYYIQTQQSNIQQELFGMSESIDLLDEPDGPEFLVNNDGCWFLLTEESMDLVQVAFPEKVDIFLQEKEIKGSKSRRRKSSLKSGGDHEKSESPKPSGIQLSITEFYRSTKVSVQAKKEEDPAKNPDDQAKGLSKEKRNISSSNLSKSVRRRLLFG